MGNPVRSGKFGTKIDPGLQIRITELGMHVRGWEGCLVWCRAGAEMYEDMRDKDYVKIGGGWCISDKLCFWTESIGLKGVEKCTEISHVCLLGVW